VFINLGTNDYSTAPQPDNSVFIAVYVKFVMSIAEHFPQAKFFLLCGPMISGTVRLSFLFFTAC